MSDQPERPFYEEYAWAYDLIIPPPTRGQIDFIAEAFAARGVRPGSRLLDAGCGTGRHAVGLARRGYVVEGVDLSRSLVEEARGRVKEETGTGAHELRVAFSVGDILDADAPSRYDGLLCRGVLNDLLDGRSRRAAFRTFARSLRPCGAVVLDVREWEASARRKIREPSFEKTFETERGALTFEAVTTVDPGTRRLIVEERHTLRAGAENVSNYTFQMRCWTREELEARMTEAGFTDFEFYGGYDLGTHAGATDRLVCVAARRPDKLM